MELVLLLVLGALLIVAVAAASPKFGISPPLLLVVAGIAISFIPGVPQLELNPEIVLIGILPPLLFSAAYNTSFVDFRANRGAILSLSVGLVIFTAAAVGFVAAWAIEGLPLAAGFALGALIAPPDAVAATAVARRVGMPRQVVSVLEGESLVNDATALTALRAAIIAIGGTVSVLEVGTDFVIAAVGGIAVGLVVALIFIPIRKRINNPSFDTVVTFTIPYVAYLPAEEIHASGVLAVVVTGLVIGHKAPLLASGTQRLTSESNWRTVGFILENAVFLMIGLQLRGLLEKVGADDMPVEVVVIACVSVFVVAAVARFVWLYLGAALLRLTRKPDRLSWAMRTVIAWAGMRGVVTLAAALALPIDFPSRDLVVVVAVVIVVASILIQGLSLPWLVKTLRLQAPDPGQLALQEAAMLDQARIAGLVRLDELTLETGDSPEVIERLRARTELRSNDAWERAGRASHGGETPLQEYQRLRLDMLVAERQAVLAARSNGTADDEVVRRVIRVLDVEESMLDQPAAQQLERQGDLVATDERGELCEHLEQFSDVAEPTPVTAAQCDDCLAEGTKWVSLRMCLTCGKVGCCDSSSGRHAERHHHETEHPVMRSAESGEAWRWCYIDRILG